jgi:hypothetical protein
MADPTRGSREEGSDIYYLRLLTSSLKTAQVRRGRSDKSVTRQGEGEGEQAAPWVPDIPSSSSRCTIEASSGGLHGECQDA